MAHLAGIEVFAPDCRKAPENPFPQPKTTRWQPRGLWAALRGRRQRRGCLSLYLSTQIELQGMVLLSPLADQSRLKDADFSRNI